MVIHLQVRAWLLLLAAAPIGCMVDLGISGKRFACTSDAECGTGYLCDAMLGVCVDESPDSGLPDAGPPPCGFDEDFLEFDNGRWARNGDTFPLEGVVQLTSLNPTRRGTLWHKQRVLADRFTFEMVFSIWGGGEVGGDGMAMAWVRDDFRALGGRAANFGIYGLDGYAVEVDTFPNTGIGDPPSEHLAVARTYGEWLPDVEMLARTTEVPALRSQRSRTLRVEFDMGDVQVFLDDQHVLTATIANYVPFEATFGVGAATGSKTDSHALEHLTLICE